MDLTRLLTLAGLVAGAGVAAGPLHTTQPAPPALLAAAPEAPPESPGAWLGVAVRTTPEALVAHLGVDRDSAVLIDSIVAGSPAQRAGLERFDLVLGARVGDAEEQALAAALRAAAPGDRLTLRILRAGEERTVVAALAERPQGDGVAPEARVDLEDGGVWSFGTGPDAEAARKQAEEAMRLAHEAMRKAMEQARQSIDEQDWPDSFEMPEFPDLPDLPQIHEFDFEFDFDHEALARHMHELAERHGADLERLQHDLTLRLEPALKAIEAHVERILEIVSREAHSALDAPLARRLAEALDQADIDAAAEQVKDAARRLVDDLGFNLGDGELRVGDDLDEIRRAIGKALEGAGVDADADAVSLDTISAWLDDWAAKISDEAGAALERLNAEFHIQPGVPAPADAPTPPKSPSPPLAQPASGGKA